MKFMNYLYLLPFLLKPLFQVADSPLISVGVEVFLLSQSLKSQDFFHYLRFHFQPLVGLAPKQTSIHVMLRIKGSSLDQHVTPVNIREGRKKKWRQKHSCTVKFYPSLGNFGSLPFDPLVHLGLWAGHRRYILQALGIYPDGDHELTG